MKIQVEKVQVLGDERGWIYEPLGPDALAGQRNVHVALTLPGAVRGNHRHQRGTEILTVPGPALVRVREEDGLRDYEVPSGEVHRFTIPPGVAHAVKNTGSEPGIMVGFNNQRHDRAQPDSVRDVLIEE